MFFWRLYFGLFHDISYRFFESSLFLSDELCWCGFLFEEVPTFLNKKLLFLAPSEMTETTFYLHEESSSRFVVLRKNCGRLFAKSPTMINQLINVLEKLNGENKSTVHPFWHSFARDTNEGAMRKLNLRFFECETHLSDLKIPTHVVYVLNVVKFRVCL